MTNTVIQLPATTLASDVEDRLREMSDGTVEMVAYEVTDHPEALHDVSLETARRQDVDPGGSLGVWFLGPRRAVEDFVMTEFGEYAEVYCVGVDAEKVAEEAWLLEHMEARPWVTS